MVVAEILNVDTECQHPTGSSPRRWSSAIVGFSFQGILYHILELYRQVTAIIVPGLSANKKTLFATKNRQSFHQCYLRCFVKLYVLE